MYQIKKKLIKISKLILWIFILTPSFSYAAAQLLAIPSQKNGKVRLEQVKISDGADNFFKARLKAMLVKGALKNSKLPAKIDLGMTTVPILDQGEYPTCVTFAVTAALDAALERGDYISQLCLLKLGHALSQQKYTGNPWDGSNADLILSLILDYGMVSKEAQLQGFCGDIKEYPLNPQHYESPAYNDLLSPENYHNISSQLIGTHKQSKLINFQKLFSLLDENYDEDPNLDNQSHIITLSNDKNRSLSPNNALFAVKKALSQNRRILLGYLISATDVTPAHYKIDKDTWFLTDELKKDVENAGINSEKGWFYHEIVLYGYDDESLARMPDGSLQKGLFYVRNSWGTERPYNHGIEFMTYDYFKMMAVDAIYIVTLDSIK
ncbi:MAG: hypothetical protein H0T84_07620 [Tatlockia sp.]|nr:hypothetical protein [Tatlockia sp.]